MASKMPVRDRSATRVGMISLGCTKNLVDSEVMLGLLKEKGYEITPHEKDADILIVNTCAFIDAAKQESMDAIIQLACYVRRNKKIIVAGCMAQRYADQLERKLKGKIHALVGVGDFCSIAEACETVLAEKGFFKRVSEFPGYIYDHLTPRLRTTPPHFAYVKIAEGCDNCCSYCVIPQVRGKYRSRPIESIVIEVSSLAQSGVKEIILIAQDTTYYGRDLGDGTDLSSLLRRLVQINGIQWIRVLYWHPAHISDELLGLIAEEEKICPYIDIPVQHIHDEMLRKMGRPTTSDGIYNLIDRICKIVPDATLRTSLIVGFPGETERYFSDLMRFVEQIQFDHLGVFAYSAEEGTKAASLRDYVPESVKKERMDRIAQLHRRIAAEKRRRLIGQQMPVLVDSQYPQATGRMQGQAPEIDDVVYIADGDVKIGEFVNVEITDTC